MGYLLARGLDINAVGRVLNRYLSRITPLTCGAHSTRSTRLTEPVSQARSDAALCCKHRTAAPCKHWERPVRKDSAGAFAHLVLNTSAFILDLLYERVGLLERQTLAFKLMVAYRDLHGALQGSKRRTTLGAGVLQTVWRAHRWLGRAFCRICSRAPVRPSVAYRYRGWTA